MITTDESQWPFVLFRSNGSVTDDQFDDYLRNYDRVLARKEKYVALFDARQAKPLELDQMKKHAQWIAASADALLKYNLGIAFVIPSPMIRGVLRAILWMRPMPQPSVVCQEVEEAVGWLRVKLVAAGLKVPDLRKVA